MTATDTLAPVTAALGKVGRAAASLRRPLRSSWAITPAFGGTGTGVIVSIDGNAATRFDTLDQARAATVERLRTEQSRQVQFIRESVGDVIEVWSRGHHDPTTKKA